MAVHPESVVLDLDYTVLIPRQAALRYAPDFIRGYSG